MRAIVVQQFGGPEELKLKDLPDPAPGPGQVVVKLEAIGVNPVETYVRAGKYGPRPFPYTPGSDGAGLVQSIGPEVKSFKPGDRVYVSASVSGTYATLTLCAEKSVHKLPSHVSFEQGAALGVPYATAHRALFHRALAKAGETVLVHGASGGVGIAAVQFARALGLTVIGSAGSEAGRQIAREQGAHHVADHHDDKHLEQVKALTQGRGVDIILEMLANKNLGVDLPALSKYGRVIVVGSRGRVEIDARDTMGRDADIRGMTLMNATDADLVGIHAAIIAGLEARTLTPVIGPKLPLADAARAHEQILEAGTLGKLLLIP